MDALQAAEVGKRKKFGADDPSSRVKGAVEICRSRPKEKHYLSSTPLGGHARVGRTPGEKGGRRKVAL